MTQEPPDPGFLYVPLQAAACGVALRLFRDRDGTRCAVGFTNLGDLIRVLGPDQQHYQLTERSVRSLAAERGVSRLIVDPGLVAAPVAVGVPVEGGVPVAAGVPVSAGALVPAVGAAAGAIRVAAVPQLIEPAAWAAPLSPSERVASPAPIPSLVPAASVAPAAPAASSESAWSGWNPQLVGLLVVSAVTGAAALVMQVIS